MLRQKPFWILVAVMMWVGMTVELVSGQGCSTIAVRREIRQLSDGERADFFNALKTLHQSSQAPTAYDSLSQIHSAYASEVHNGAAFCPWHRQYLRELEKKLQKINPRVVIPYWDWTIDSQAPHKSEIFTSKYLGGNGGNNNQGGCLTNGPFAGWQMRYPNKHCLTRKFNNGSKIGAFYSSDVIAKIANNSNTYADFRSELESPIHGVVHMGIGGDMTVMTSPNDPLFWLHHAFIDKIWADWQASNPARSKNYSGKRSKGGNALVTDIMNPFNVPVSAVLDTTAPGLCYRYSNSPSTTRNKRRAIPDFDPAAPLAQNQDALKLHVPEMLDEGWITRNGGNVVETRTKEQRLAGIIQQYNVIKNYISPNAMARREDTLSKLSYINNNTFHEYYCCSPCMLDHVPNDRLGSDKGTVRSSLHSTTFLSNSTPARQWCRLKVVVSDVDVRSLARLKLK
ncbi:Di-copper centre-containing protein [Basidiobolus meristosporus CBS 931.73]|uniref:Di-copper centre-containing protein n=1 Tax=Basidiobolus meristosporus CBS 931.73 TaxID=1314790 RepID=A0A1Y1ZC58_9FUNG|nr:Di-copper centre-containing protein [Basidiobolus meristosporus CBS 931.73]|eukprot:ORY07829.1 Di-copper centre-containing protein [Basidiobolus meristosporus CBS 931.73]